MEIQKIYDDTGRILLDTAAIHLNNLGIPSQQVSPNLGPQKNILPLRMLMIRHL
jgi:hypothetical protein